LNGALRKPRAIIPVLVALAVMAVVVILFIVVMIFVLLD